MNFSRLQSFLIEYALSLLLFELNLSILPLMGIFTFIAPIPAPIPTPAKASGIPFMRAFCPAVLLIHGFRKIAGG